jgi:hypothetical protein
MHFAEHLELHQRNTTKEGQKGQSLILAKQLK